MNTHRIQEGENINALLDQYITTLEEKSIVAIISKVIVLSTAGY